MAQQLRFPNEAIGGSGRPLRLAFVIDPLDQLKAWKDSTVAMMRAKLEKRCRSIQRATGPAFSPIRST